MQRIRLAIRYINRPLDMFISLYLNKIIALLTESFICRMQTDMIYITPLI